MEVEDCAPVATEIEGSPQLPTRCFGCLGFIFPGCSFALLAWARPLLPRVFAGSGLRQPIQAWTLDQHL